MKLATAFAALALTVTAVHAQGTPQLQHLLSQLDASSKSFRNAQADVTYDNYTYVVKDHDIENGTLYVERAGNAVTMGAIFLINGGKSKVISYDGQIFQLYTVGTNQDDVFNAGAGQARYESIFSLGFGGSGVDLAKNWKITDRGPETIGGVNTEKLDLVPKDPSLLQYFTQVTIWIDPTRDVSLKQIFYAPNKDTRTTTYSNIKLNTHIDKKAYSIPSKAQRVQH